MNLELYVAILIIALSAGLTLAVYLRNRQLQGQLEQLQSHDQGLEPEPEPIPSPIPGLSSTDFQQLMDDFLEDNEDYLLVFDSAGQLRRLNRRAKVGTQVQEGQSFTELHKHLKTESLVSFHRLQRQIFHDKKASADPIVLEWQNAGPREHRFQLLKDPQQNLKAVMLIARDSDHGETEQQNPELMLAVENLSKPVGQLKILSKQMDSFLNKSPMDSEQLKQIGDKQDSLIDSTRMLLDYYKNVSAQLDLSEPSQSLSMNAVVRTAGLLMESNSFVVPVRMQKKLQGQDVLVLLQQSNFQRSLLRLVQHLLERANAVRARAEINLSWEPGPMECRLTMRIGVSQLGQDLGGLWMSGILSERKDFVDFQTHFASLSCSLENFRKDGQELVVELVLPRDLIAG